MTYWSNLALLSPPLQLLFCSFSELCTLDQKVLMKNALGLFFFLFSNCFKKFEVI